MRLAFFYIIMVASVCKRFLHAELAMRLLLLMIFFFVSDNLKHNRAAFFADYLVIPPLQYI